MIEYLSLAEVATKMGLPTETLTQKLAGLGLLASATRPSMCALVTRVDLPP